MPALRTREVITSEWMPSHDPMDYPDDFVEFIDSINSDWRDRTAYKPYELYKLQAQQWLDDNDSIYHYREFDEQADWIIKETKRCQQNTLYAANKYGFLKEGDIEGGGIKYDAFEPQRLLLFLADSRYNAMIGKARQIGFTSTVGLLATIRANFTPSYFVKFITHTESKGIEIFNDKIQWPFGRIPDYLRNKVHNFSHSEMTLRNDAHKGEMGGMNSKILVSAPTVDAINGGSPNLVLVDEISYIDIFGKMLREGRPALYFYDPKDKKMKMRRQMLAWGTGGVSDKALAVFEAEYRACMEAWKERHFNYGIIPLFFNAYAREGVTEKLFEQERKTYYAVQGIEAESSKTQFHMHYPMSVDDMFLKSAKTLLPVPEINRQLLRIYSVPAGERVQYGYFEPVFDRSVPLQESDVPYKVIGAKWIPTTGMDDERTSACIKRHPEPNWEYRYYQGTDPINSETGHSKMSSSIWDALDDSDAATVFYRTNNPKEAYLQCTLLGLYYQPGQGCPELLENNIGDGYYDYLEAKGFSRRLIATQALPQSLHTNSGKWWGISNRTNTAGRIINRLIEMLDECKERIHTPWFWLQLKTFIEKTLTGAANSASGRQTRYQAADLRYNYDDAIFSKTFSRIAAQCYIRYEPRENTPEKKQKKVIRKYVQNAQTNFQLRLAEVDENGRVLKYIDRTGGRTR